MHPVLITRDEIGLFTGPDFTLVDVGGVVLTGRQYSRILAAYPELAEELRQIAVHHRQTLRIPASRWGPSRQGSLAAELGVDRLRACARHGVDPGAADAYFARYPGRCEERT